MSRFSFYSETITKQRSLAPLASCLSVYPARKPKILYYTFTSKFHIIYRSVAIPIASKSIDIIYPPSQQPQKWAKQCAQSVYTSPPSHPPSYHLHNHLTPPSNQKQNRPSHLPLHRRLHPQARPQSRRSTRTHQSLRAKPHGPPPARRALPRPPPSAIHARRRIQRHHRHPRSRQQILFKQRIFHARRCSLRPSLWRCVCGIYRSEHAYALAQTGASVLGDGSGDPRGVDHSHASAIPCRRV